MKTKKDYFTWEIKNGTNKEIYYGEGAEIEPGEWICERPSEYIYQTGLLIKYETLEEAVNGCEKFIDNLLISNKGEIKREDIETRFYQLKEIKGKKSKTKLSE